MNYSLDFVGGTSTTVTFRPRNIHWMRVDSEMIPDLEDITGDPNIQVQTVQDSTQVVFKTQTLDLSEREAFAQYMSDNYGVDGEGYCSPEYQRYCKFGDAYGRGCRGRIIATSLYADLYLVPV